jgi:hypothetical protein
LRASNKAAIITLAATPDSHQIVARFLPSLSRYTKNPDSRRQQVTSAIPPKKTHQALSKSVV